MSESSEIQRAKERARKGNKMLGTFPSSLHHILAYFERGREAKEMEVRFDSVEAARALRFKWYDFKKALRAQSPLRSDIADTVLCQIRGSSLVFTHRDMEAWNLQAEEQILAQMFGEGAEETPNTTHPATTSTLQSTEDLFAGFAKTGTVPKPGLAGNSITRVLTDDTPALSIEELMKKEMGIE